MGAASAAPRRVLVASNFLPPQTVGGAELVAWRELTGLAARGHAVQGFTAQWEGVSGDGECEGVRVVRIAAPRRRLAPGRHTLPFPPFDRSFEALIREFRPEVVHFHNVAGFPLSMLDIPARHGVPAVLTVHDGWAVCPKSVLLRRDGSACGGARSFACVWCAARSSPSPARKYRIWSHSRRVLAAYTGVRCLLFPSRHHRDLYVRAGVAPERCRLLANSLDARWFGPTAPPDAAPDRPLRLAYLGNLGRHKGVDVLVEAVARLPTERVVLSIHGQGDGRKVERLLQRCRGLGIGDRVAHGGYLANERVPGALANCDVVVVPSRCVENSPMTIMEGMAAHRAVIASRVGGTGELVEEGVTGELVPPGDAAALAAAIARFAADRERAPRMGAEAGRRAAVWTVERHVEQLERIFGELVVS